MTVISSEKEITIRQINSTKEFEALQEKWDQLFNQNHLQTAFLTWVWLFSWWKIYREEKELWLLTAWQDNNELVGIFPLMLEKEKIKGFTFRSLRSLGNPQSDVGGLLIKANQPEIVHAFLQHIIAQKKKWDQLELNYFLKDDYTLALIKEDLHKAGMVSREKVYTHFHVPLEKNWKTLLSKLSRKFRKNLRRAARNASRTGDVKLEHFTEDEINWTLFEQIIQMNKHAHFPLLYNSPKEQAFHKELQQQPSGRQILTVFILSINNKPVAYEYGFIAPKRYEAWRAGYDTRVDPTISIGKLLAQLATEHAFELGYTEIDFLRGNESYKLDWKPNSRTYTKNRFVRKINLPARYFFVWLPKTRVWIKNHLLKNL